MTVKREQSVNRHNVRPHKALCPLLPVPWGRAPGADHQRNKAAVSAQEPSEAKQGDPLLASRQNPAKRVWREKEEQRRERAFAAPAEARRSGACFDSDEQNDLLPRIPPKPSEAGLAGKGGAAEGASFRRPGGSETIRSLLRRRQAERLSDFVGRHISPWNPVPGQRAEARTHFSQTQMMRQRKKQNQFQQRRKHENHKQG